MSETTETAVPQDGGAPASAPEPAVADAPAAEGAATETDTTDEPAEAEQKRSRATTAQRIASLGARVAAGEAERARMAAELEHYRRQVAPQPERPPTAEDIPRIVAQQVAERLAQERAQERATGFHDAGRAAYSDWEDRCKSLVAMGADPQIADLMLEIPNGARVAGALADDPERMEAIAAIKTERGRAIALGKYAAELDAKPSAPARPSSRAPAPIRPIAGGAQRVEFNEYLETDANRLAEHYARQAMEKRRGLR